MAMAVKSGAVFDKDTSIYTARHITADGRTHSVPGGGEVSIKVMCDGHAATLAASTAAIAAITVALY